MTTPSWAMILSAGIGSRLLPLTNYLPKPCLELWGKPIIFHQLDMLKKANIKNVAINIHHKADKFKEILYNYKTDINIQILHEETLLGTGGGLKNAIEYLDIKNTPLLLLQGDIIIDYDITKLFNTNNFCTLLCIKDKIIDGYDSNIGVDENGFIIELGKYFNAQKPSHKRGFFSGVHYLSHEALFLIKKSQKFGLVDEIYPLWLKEGEKIVGLMVDTFYDDLGTPKRLLETNLAGFYTKFKHINNFEFDHKKKIYIHKTATIEKDTKIGPYAIIGENTIIKSKAFIERSVVFKDTIIEKNERIFNALALIKERVFL